MIGKPLTILDEVESSNNYATSQVEQGLAHHGHGFLARYQSAGKGQRGKVWKGESGQNIALSIVLEMKDIELSRNFELSMAIALGVYDFFSNYAGDETRIKWPNDIYWRDRKAVGILIENNIKGKIWQWAIAGIGINMNQTEFEGLTENKAVSLRQITGQLFNIEVTAQELCRLLEKRYQQFLHSPQQILKDYNTLLFKRNEIVPICYKDQIFKCRIDSVDSQGKLWVKGGPVPYFQFGEISWMLHHK